MGVSLFLMCVNRCARALDSHTTSLSLSSSVPKPRQATGLSGDNAAGAATGEGGLPAEGDTIGAPLPAAGAGSAEPPGRTAVAGAVP